MKNKIISVLLALVMIVSMMPVVAFAAEGGLIYSQTDENLGGKTKWPATAQYVKTLTLEGATIDSCTYNDARILARYY